MNTPSHIPVLPDQVKKWLPTRPDGIYIDGTFGAGGHSQALLDHYPCRVFAIDRDPRAIAGAVRLKERYRSRLTLIQGHFSQMRELLAEHGVFQAHGVLFDLGLSSMQLASGGFSFRGDADLDMRMDTTGASARDLVNRSGEKELEHILRQYGEEKKARAIARAIVAARRQAPIMRTGVLADIIRSVLGHRRPGKIDPATRSFQAIRIAVNDELTELRQGLSQAEHILVADGRLAVISFHSLEDRIVKNFFRPAPSQARGAPGGGIVSQPSWALLHRGCLRPQSAEVEMNPRARSARMRVARRLGSSWAAKPVLSGKASSGRAVQDSGVMAGAHRSHRGAEKGRVVAIGCGLCH